MAERLFEAARAAMAKARAPYSNFPVGAAIRTTEGTIHVGANVEVVSLPEGWCAETTAISHMVMSGGGEIAEIAIVAGRMARCTPCGGCRQRLAEFGSPQTKVHLCDAAGIVQTVTLGELLPLAFDAEALR